MADDADGDSEGSVQLWLVDRSYDDKGLVQLVYATPDGESHRRFEWAAASLARREVTAAVEADPDDLEPVAAEERERYRDEVRRVRDRHDPDEEL